jgi:amino acid transporter
MFMSLFVIYGFDTASTLAEETHNPRREAPRAVLSSIGGAFVIGTIFLLCTLVAIPNLAAEMAKGAPPADIITANLPGWAGNLYLLVVSAAIYVCCLSIQTSTIRLMFGMARDDQLPVSRAWRSVHSGLHTPIGACLGVGVLAAVPLLYYAGAGIVAIAATGMIYLSYFLGNIAILRARLSGWPKEEAPFKLGGWGTAINVLALLWGGSMLINFMWPRPCCNPGLTAFAPGLTGTLGGLPIFEVTLGVILVVGAIYWFAVQQGKPAKIVAPREGSA